LIDLSFDDQSVIQSAIQPSPTQKVRYTMEEISVSNSIPFDSHTNNPFKSMHENWTPPPSTSILV